MHSISRLAVCLVVSLGFTTFAEEDMAVPLPVTVSVGGEVAVAVKPLSKVVVDDPSLVNAEPFAGGWLIKVSVAGGAPDGLLDRDAYVALTEG